MGGGNIKKTAVTVMLIIYLLTPYSLFGLSGGDGCSCSLGSYRCGENGYVCHCCKDFEFDFGTPSYTKCRIGAKFFSVSQPPAMMSMVFSTEASFIYLRDVTTHEVEPRTVDLTLPEKPPSA